MEIRETARLWVLMAKRDLERAEHSLEIGDRAAAVFWSQQAVEKALKGLLMAFKGWFPKTHNIRKLFMELGMTLGLDDATLEASYELTQYYHLARYPDLLEDLPDEVISGETARRAVEIAAKVVGRAEKAMEQATRTG